MFLPAFSIFAFVEYFVAAANMFFYWSVVLDMPDEEVVVMRPEHKYNELKANGSIKSNQEESKKCQ